MESQIKHKGLDIAESVEFFLSQAQNCLAERKYDDFFEIIDSVIKEIESGGKELDVDNPEYSLANARVLLCGANLRVLMIICESLMLKTVNLSHLYHVKEKVIGDILEAKEHLAAAKVVELNAAISFIEEKLTSILDRYHNA